jgi:glycosyltransferase involved in cell wall biosynthesis
VIKDKQQKEELVVTTRRQDNLFETIVYYKEAFFLQRLLSWKKYYSVYKSFIRQFIKEHGLPNLVHVQVPVKAGLMALWMKRTYGIPYVCTEHFGIYNNEVKDPFIRRSFYFRYFTRKIFREAARLMPVSDSLGKAICSLVIKKEYQVIPNVVDTRLFFLPSVASRVPGEKFRFIHVSDMSHIKNPDGIIRACQKLYTSFPHFEMVLVGPYPQEVLDMVQHTGLLNTAIFFTGLVDYEAVAHQMQQSHALILFSHSESMSCVIVEALCCGLPVISTKVGIAPEVLNSSNGLLVEVRDEQALFQSMHDLMHNYDRYNREQIATVAQQQFNYAAIGKQLHSIYNATGI